MRTDQTIIDATVNMAKEWINRDETAKQMLDRVLKQRPLLLLPHPLHRIPLGINNIVEIVGPSNSAKTEILIQIAINCILPNNRNGIHYGGLEHSVLFLDLDCRLDIFRLSQSLKLQITNKQKGNDDMANDDMDIDLFTECMKRFSYTRCYDSFEFLAALKLLNSKLVNENRVRVVMIDNIGAFNWIDRGFSSLPQTNPSRKNLCLQNVFENVVNEIKKLMSLHPLLVLVTKTVTVRVKNPYSKRVSGCLNETYREYMPLIWQSFVTQRILVRELEDERNVRDRVCYTAEWLLPALNILDEFVVCDTGILSLIDELE